MLIRTIHSRCFAHIITGVISCILGFTQLTAVAQQNMGITDTAIRVGGIMDLLGSNGPLLQEFKAGIEAAFRNFSHKGRRIEYTVLDDSYNPQKTLAVAQQLLERGIFIMLGNSGTAHIKNILPLLAENKVPIMGMYTGAEAFRPGLGDIINVRASYSQEMAAVIEAALKNDVQPASICVFAQNDSFGMDGLAAIKNILAKKPGTEEIVKRFEEILAVEGDDPARNNLGPVGVYTRNTRRIKDAYQSLRNWQDRSGNACQLVMTASTVTATADMVAYSRYKGERWVFSTLSVVGANILQQALAEHNINDGIIMTQVVPDPLTSTLPIVLEARKTITDADQQMSYPYLEGYIVGRLFTHILQSITGDLNREKFLSAIYGKKFSLGGLEIDFSNDNQASDFVQLTYLREGNYIPADTKVLATLFQR